MEHRRRVFLGFALAASIILLTRKNPLFFWVAIGFLFARFVPLKIFDVIADKIEGVFKLIGTAISRSALFVLYLILITPYAALYRRFNSHAVSKFLGKRGESSFYVRSTRVYDHEFFKKSW